MAPIRDKSRIAKGIKIRSQLVKESLIAKCRKNHDQSDYFQTSTVENKEQVLQNTKYHPCHCYWPLTVLKITAVQQALTVVTAILTAKKLR